MKGKIDIMQACILLRINGNTLKTLIRKYSNEGQKSLLQWKKVLNGDGIKIEEID